MQHGDTFEARAKPGAALAANPQRQCNFRNQHQRGFLARERFLNSAQVDFGFAAAGDAIEQLHAKFAEFEPGANAFQGVILLGIEFVGGRRVAHVKRVLGGIDGFLPTVEQAFGEHAVDCGARHLG
jgi:hypothetical protein